MAEEGKKYVTHGMYAECSMGTMKNYLNTDVGHGVVYQGQPLLNANDHVPQINLTHFGDCNSKMIYEEAKKQLDEKYKAEEGDNFLERAGKAIAGSVAKAAVTAQEYLTVNKCQLDTPLPWRFCNEEHMIDGAPALTMDSVCPCRYGGIISIVDMEAIEEEAAARAAEAAAEEAAAQKEYIDMMEACYGFDDTSALLIQKAYNLSLGKGNLFMQFQKACDRVLGNEEAFDFVANMAAFVYDGELPFAIIDGIPDAETAKKYFKRLGLSDQEVSDLADAVKKQYVGKFQENKNKEEKKDFAHEMAVYAGYFNNNKLHREIFDIGILQLILGDMETLNSYEGDVFSASMDYDDMNTDMDALNIYNLYIKAEDRDLLEIMTEYNQGVLNKEINRAESFLENLGNGNAEKGLENLKADLGYGGLGGFLIGLGKEKSEKEDTKQKFLDYIIEERGAQ